MAEKELVGTGVNVRVDHFKDKIPKFDAIYRRHYWVISGMWSVDAEAWVSGESNVLDHENLVSVIGPACYFCEKYYNPFLAAQICTGDPSGV